MSAQNPRSPWQRRPHGARRQHRPLGSHIYAPGSEPTHKRVKRCLVGRLRKDRVLVEFSIPFRALVTRHAALRLMLARAINVLHVSPHLDDIHPPVPIERDRHRLLDVRLAQHEFQPVARGQLDRLHFLLRRKHRHLHCERRRLLFRRHRRRLALLSGGGKSGHGRECSG